MRQGKRSGHDWFDGFPCSRGMMTFQALFQRESGWEKIEKLFMLALFQIRLVTSMVVLRSVA
jgi:hypothetical protein